MIKTCMRLGGMAALTAAAFGLGRTADAANVTVTVLSNNTTPGDTINGPSAPAALGTSDWYYNNVTTGGTVGVNTTYAKDGNGSVFFNPVNPGGIGGVGKADLLYSTGTNLGQLKDLTNFAYDWYRSSALSSTGLTQTVALKLMLSNDSTKYFGASQRGEFVFEPYYTTGNVTSDAWIHEDIIANDGKMWVTGTLPAPSGYQYQDYSTFLDPQGNYYLGDFYVWGVIAGVGSGWQGTFNGAADNITFGFKGGDVTTYNFEVRSATPAVPEPGSIALGLIAGGLGLAGAAWRRRRVG